MLRRRSVRFLLTGLAVAALAGGAVVAQLEAGDRGIPPIDSSSTLEITGIKVDVSAKSAEAARFAGWRIAQREGFKALWAKIGPTRYIATLGVLFDRARSAELLGAQGQVRRSAPMLLIPITVSGGTETSVELRNAWQRAWAEYRTSNSAVDYVRVSGLGMDPLLVNAAQVRRPGRGWWRNIIDLYGAADVLVAEVQLRRIYPGGPAVATFIGYHGPDRQPLGTFTLRAPNSAGIPEMMNQGVEQMDALFTRALAAGMLRPDPSLIIPEEPAPVEEIEEETEATTANVIQVSVTSPYSPVGWLRSIPSVESVTEVGSAVLVVRYRGSAGQLQAALQARGWQADTSTGVLRITGYAGPPAPAPQQPQSQPAQPTQPPEPIQPVPTGGAES